MSENKQPVNENQAQAGGNPKHLNIGKKLRDAREEKGYTLDDLQQITKIQKRYLIAIEDQNFKALPGDFYVRAFVKQYADTVGLNGNELLKDYDDELPETKTSEYSEHITQAVETRSSHHRTAEKMENARRKYLPTIIIAAIVIVILLVIWISAIARHRDNSTKIDRSQVSVSGESSHKTKKKASSSSKKKTKKSAAIKLTEGTRTASSVTYNAKSLKKKTNLQIQASASAWNSVTVDGSQRLGKTMNAGDKANVVIAKNATSVVIRLGNASKTTVKIGGKKIDITDGGRYPATRTVVINFGNNSSSSASSSTTTTTSRQTTTTNNQNNTQTSRQTTTTNNNTQQTTTNRQPTSGQTTTNTETRQQGTQQ